MAADLSVVHPPVTHRVPLRRLVIAVVALVVALSAVSLQLYRVAPPATPDSNGRWRLDVARVALARDWVPGEREGRLLAAAASGNLDLTLDAQGYRSVSGGQLHRSTCSIASRDDGLTAVTLDQPDPLLGAELVFQAVDGQVVLRLGGEDPLLLPLVRQPR